MSHFGWVVVMLLRQGPDRVASVSVMFDEARGEE
jgi:hypothetical protein